MKTELENTLTISGDWQELEVVQRFAHALSKARATGEEVFEHVMFNAAGPFPDWFTFSITPQKPRTLEDLAREASRD